MRSKRKKCAQKESWAPECLLRLMQSFSPARKRTRLMIRSEGQEFFTAMDWNRRPVCTKRSYLADFSDRPPVQLLHHLSEPPRSHRSPLVCALLWRLELRFPRCHWISVRPSGHLPSYYYYYSSLIIIIIIKTRQTLHATVWKLPVTYHWTTGQKDENV